MLPSFKKSATLEEFQYYIKNNKWPYGSYLTNYITNNKDATLKSFSWLKLSSTEEVQEVMPSRTLYEMLINPVEMKQTPMMFILAKHLVPFRPPQAHPVCHPIILQI